MRIKHIQHLVLITSFVLLVFAVPRPASLSADEAQPALTFREIGQIRGTLNQPHDVTVGPDDRIYVADTFDHQIEVFTPDGVHIASIGAEGQPGEGMCGLEHPLEVAVGPDSKVFVLDKSLTMKVFDSNFNCVTAIPIGFQDDFYPWHWDDYVRTIVVNDLGYILIETGASQLLVFDPQLNHVHTVMGLDLDRGLAKGPGNTIYGLTDKSIAVIDSNFELVNTIFDSTGDDTYRFSKFWDIAVDSSGLVYVTVTDNDIFDPKLLIFNSDGTLVSSVGGMGPGDYQYVSPNGVAVSSSGNIVVADSSQNRVKIYNSQLDYLLSLDPATYPDYQGLFGDLYIGAGGKIYARNGPNQSIHVFSPDLSSLGRITDFPAFAMIIAEGKDGKIYAMADGIDEQSIRILNSDLSPHGVIGMPDEPGSDNNHFGRITDFDIGPDGRLYVADYSNHRVQVFNSDRAYYRTLGVTGVPGSDNIHFDSPSRVYFDSEGFLYVLDWGNLRVQVFDAVLNYSETLYFAPYIHILATTPNMEYYGDTGLNVNILYPNLSLKASFDVSPVLDELTNGQYSQLDIRGIEVAENGLIYIQIGYQYVLVYDRNLYFLTSYGNPTEFTIFDIALDSSENLVITDGTSIRILSLNTAPVATADSYSATTGMTLTIVANEGVLANDTDPENDPLTVTLVTAPAHATSFNLDAWGGFTYVPEDGFTGQDSFTYQASDGLLLSEVATVTITVNEAPSTETPDPTDESTVEPTPQSTEEPTPASTPEPTEESTSEVTPVPTVDPALPPSAPRNLSVNPRQGRPEIIWSDDIQAEWFRIYISNADYTVTWLDAWVQRADYCDSGVCSVIPPIDPLPGQYHVWMQAWGQGHYSIGGSTGTDGWSHAQFTLPDIPPGPVEGLTYTVSEGIANVMWQAEDYATWYNVWIGTGSPDWAPSYFDWMHVDDLGCGDGNVCTFPANLAPGDYVWYVRSWGPGGFNTGGLPDAPGWVQGPEIRVD